jgi:hypothetical protein
MEWSRAVLQVSGIDRPDRRGEIGGEIGGEIWMAFMSSSPRG